MSREMYNVLLYDQCAVYKTHINFLANKMD